MRARAFLRGPRRVASLGTMLLLGLGVAAYVRGTRASAAENNPATAAEGVRCQLFDAGGGHRPVRCAAVVDAPPAAVADVVRDYQHFSETFSSRSIRFVLTSITDEPGGVAHLVGRVETPVRAWPLDARVRHERAAGDAFVASWEEPRGAMLENRGSWTVRPAPGGGALLVYQLEVRQPGVPTFLINNVLLAQLGYPVRRVLDRVRAVQRAGGP